MTYLPSPSFVRRSSLVVIFLLLFEKMRFALEGETDTLYACRGKANNYSQLHKAISMADQVQGESIISFIEARLSCGVVVKTDTYSNAGACGELDHGDLRS